MAAGRTDPQVVLRPSPMHVRRLISLLGSNTSLLGLDLQRCELDDALTTLLAEALCENTVLISLDLGMNKVGPRGCTSLAGMLRTNRTLRSLILDQNPLSVALSARVNDFSGVEALAHSLKTNTTLQSLSLFKCGIGARGGDLIAKSLSASRETTGLIALNLFYNNVHAEATATIMSVVEESKVNGLAERKRRKEQRAEKRAVDDDLKAVATKKAEIAERDKEIAANRVKRANARARASLNARAEERQAVLDAEAAVAAALAAEKGKKKKKKKKKK